MKNCKFCQIVQKNVQDYIIWEDSNFLAFLTKKPAKVGHCVIIPKKHSNYIFDMEEDLYLGIFKTAKKISGPLRKFFGAKRIGIVATGFEVPHVHLHMIPLHDSYNLFYHNTTIEEKPAKLLIIQEKLKKILDSV